MTMMMMMMMNHNSGDGCRPFSLSLSCPMFVHASPDVADVVDVDLAMFQVAFSIVDKLMGRRRQDAVWIEGNGNHGQ